MQYQKITIPRHVFLTRVEIHSTKKYGDNVNLNKYVQTHVACFGCTKSLKLIAFWHSAYTRFQRSYLRDKHIYFVSPLYAVFDGLRLYVVDVTLSRYTGCIQEDEIRLMTASSKHTTSEHCFYYYNLRLRNKVAE